MQDLETAVAASVGELVGHRLNDDDRWNLALVQRDEVWDQVRMRHLLDSLLADYPIGAVLLCRVKGSSKVIRVDGPDRRQEEAAPGAWQLLDGQQRINALFSMFSDQGNYGRFYLNMTVERQPPGPVQSRSTKDRALPYIAHRESPDEDIENHDRFIDLSRWASWAGSQEELVVCRQNS